MIPALLILRKLLPVVKEVFTATRKKSDGGKRITPEERQQIIAAALPKMAAILDRELDR